MRWLEPTRQEMSMSAILVATTLSGATLEHLLTSNAYATRRKLREGAVDWFVAMMPLLPTYPAEVIFGMKEMLI